MYFMKEKIISVFFVFFGGIWMDYVYLKGKVVFNFKKKKVGEGERKEKGWGGGREKENSLY